MSSASGSSAAVVTRTHSGHRKRGHSDGDGHHPSKRRRLGQASVLCVREMFRNMVSDGEITDEHRIILQNVCVLLSQVDGKTWVNFPETEGELHDLPEPQLKTVKPFLKKVAEELKASQTQLIREDSHSSLGGEESIDVLELLAVPWSDGISARELLTCCMPDEEVDSHPWIDKAARVLPTRYMIRSRVRELINYYQLQHLKPQQNSHSSSSPRTSLLQRAQDAGWPGAGCLISLLSLLASFLRLSIGVAKTLVISCVVASKWLVSHSSYYVTQVVLAFAGFILWSVSKLSEMGPACQGPLWPTIRFLIAALAEGQVRHLLNLTIMIVKLRVILCLANCNDFAGWLFFPFVFIAKKALKWNEGSHFMGCACADSETVSVLSWLPVRASDVIAMALRLVRFTPLPNAMTETLLQGIDILHPTLSFVFDLMFSIGISNALKMVADHVEHNAKPKLVWMSMNVARMMRSRSCYSPETSSASPVAETVNSESPTSAGAQVQAQDVPGAAAIEVPTAVPEWREDGEWSLQF